MTVVLRSVGRVGGRGRASRAEPKLRGPVVVVAEDAEADAMEEERQILLQGEWYSESGNAAKRAAAGWSNGTKMGEERPEYAVYEVERREAE